MVYLIQNETEGICKIGYSLDPNARLATLQTGCPYPLSLVGTIEGGREKERETHAMFEQYRMEGEWFVLNKEILSFFNVPSNISVNIYLEGIDIWAKYSGAEKGVILCIFKYIDYNTNEFLLSPARREEISICGNIAPNTVNSSIARLVKKNIFIRKSGNTYVLNPKLFFYGKDLERSKLMKATITYEIPDSEESCNC